MHKSFPRYMLSPNNGRIVLMIEDGRGVQVNNACKDFGCYLPDMRRRWCTKDFIGIDPRDLIIKEQGYVELAEGAVEIYQEMLKQRDAS